MRHFLLPLLLLLTYSGVAQNQPTDSVAAPSASAPSRRDTRPWSERIRFGGNTGVWFNTKQAHVNVSALLAYHFPKILTTGVGYRYIFTRNYLYGKNLNSYGPNIFARAGLTRRIYLWTEWEYLTTEYIVSAGGAALYTDKTGVQSFFGGMGYVRQIGKKGRGGISFQLLYNFLYDREVNSPYWSPVTYRVGYFF
jgi:hypothetical protein